MGLEWRAQEGSVAGEIAKTGRDPLASGSRLGFFFYQWKAMKVFKEGQ